MPEKTLEQIEAKLYTADGRFGSSRIEVRAALQQARDLGRAEPPLDPEVLMTWYRNHAGFHYLVDAFAVTKLDRVVNEAVAEERKALVEEFERMSKGRVLDENLLFKADVLEVLQVREKESR